MSLVEFSAIIEFSGETQKDVDVSATIQDATRAVPCLFDSLGNVVLYQMQAISAAVIRISSEAPITGTYRLVVLGPAAFSFSQPSLAVGGTPPTVGQLKTYGEFRAKIEVDLDLQEEVFITPNELVGYFNEGIEEAESEILKLDEDYFLTSAPVNLVQGQSAYPYPANIYGYKVRGLVYSSGSVTYNVRKFRRKNKFENLAFAAQSTAEGYSWYPLNPSAGNPTLNILPAARESSTDEFSPLTLWYIRHANRVPLIGQYVLNWDVVNQAAGINTGSSQIAVGNTYVTGDRVKLGSSGSVPQGTTANLVYYVILVSPGLIKLATSLQNALAGTAVTLVSPGFGPLSISIAATQAIVDNTVIDIPEFTKFVVQWAKCRCMEKEGDPRLQGAALTLEQQRKQMVSTLTEAQQDDQNEVEADFSAYTEMS